MRRLRLRRPGRKPLAHQPDPPETEAGAEHEETRPSEISQWTGGSDLASRASTFLVLVALVAAPATLVITLLRPPPTPVAAAASQTGHELSSQAEVAEFAEHLVQVWIEAQRGDEALLEPYVDVSSVTLPQQASNAKDATLASLEPGDEPGEWAATVGVSIWSGQQAPVRRYFGVAIARVGQGLRALTLPSPVAAPSQGSAVDLTYPERVSSTEPVTRTVQGFLVAYLTGAAEVARYTAPGAAIPAVTPPPFERVEISDIRADVTPPQHPEDAATVRVLVTAASTSAGREQSVQYPLRLVARDGRWEVAEIEQHPPFAEPPETDPGMPTGTSRP